MASPQRRLAPWEETEYFDTPTESNFTNLNVRQVVAEANPHRVALIFSAFVGQVCCSTKSTVVVNQGFNLSANVPTVTLTEAEYGPLVQLEWFAIAPAATSLLTVFEVFLREFPNESG